MVDRITPVTTDADRAEVAERFGIEDRWPVVCEPYTQWVLEDAFTAGRPPYERAGVQLVDQVEPYELMKLRLLNASHHAMCYFAYLSAYRLADGLPRLAGRQREDPDAFIANRDVFGALADDKRFVPAYRSALASLHQHGARATLESLV